MMQMFAKNVNTANPIHLFVGFDEVETTIDLEGTSNKQGKSSARVWEIEDEAIQHMAPPYRRLSPHVSMCAVKPLRVTLVA